MANPGLRAVCEAAAERWAVPALVVAVSADARRETVAVGCDEGTRFRIASITKPFTATLALSLLDLDGDVGVWPDVRVRHLLSHTSGFECECGDLARFGDGDDALDRVVDELPSVPRSVSAETAWSYSNAGYWLAGWLCARAAETTYEEALEARVLRPAGLEETSFGEPKLAGTGRAATGRAYPRGRRPSGGLVSTAADLLRFAEWQLSERTTDALRTPVAKPAAGVYGLGFAGQRVGGADVWGHDGSYGGFESSLLLLPSRGAAFVGLTNSGRGSQALREIEDAVFERLLGTRRALPKTVRLPAHELQSFAGTYANSDLRAAVEVAGDGLRAEVVDLATATGTPAETVTVDARPIGPTTFEIVGGDFAREWFDFPLPDFARVASRLAARAA